MAYRYRISAIGLAALAVFAALHALALRFYEFFTRVQDGVAKAHPFVDTLAVLQAGGCWRAGVDVYHPSACLDGGVFNYSPVLLRIGLLGLGPHDTLAVGLLLCLAFLAALALLPAPARGGEFRLRLAASLSPASYYALEQGNLDAGLFAAVALAVWLLWRVPKLRLAAYGIFALGAAAKFYPVSCFVLALREKRRVVLALAGAGLAGLAFVAWRYGHGVAAALAIIPSGTPFRASFGRIDLPRGLAMLHLLHFPPGAVSWAMAAGMLGGGWTLRKGWARALAALDEGRRLYLVTGAVVTLFCFLAAQNIEYRAVYLLLTLPGLWLLGRRRLLATILLLLWEAVPRALISGLVQPYLPAGPAVWFWLLREGLWWWVALEFTALSFAFVARQAPRLFRVKN
ncbi:hypothetical protein [Acidocella aromatica]|uniref:DUF2029 domain-containing protein n=1 Tax=Acidocella aromatica TaxID=1303579 RepID=A0A840VL57_9PROT|nr:hypothetical protein [Acidocella aromatica]MBB5372949.1 hypothetical protein [Acidocella aromatica]